MKLLVCPYLFLIWRTPVSRRGASVCVVLALLSSAAEIAVAMSLVPIFVSLGVDAGSELAGFVDGLPPAGWLVLFALAASVRSMVNWLSEEREERATQELVVSLQSRLYRALAAAHWDTVRRISPPTITSALQMQTYEAGYGFSNVIHVIAAAFLVIGYIVAAAAVLPIMLPVLLLILAIIWQINVRRNEQVRVYSEDYVDAQTELHQRYEDWVAINRISSLGVDAGKLADRFVSGAREAAAHEVGYSRSAGATRVSYDLAVLAGIVIGVPVAWWLETPPALLAFGLVAFMRVMPRASTIQIGYQGVINAVAPLDAVERLSEKLESDPVAPPAAHAALDWRRLKLAKIGIEDTLREGGRRWILRDVGLEIKHNEWLAFTGSTGAGKTTLAEVMLMLLRTDAGEMSIDGKILDDDLAGKWRDQAAYVPQDVVLFDASIRDNLRLYVPDATDAELQTALGQAAADFVMTTLPEGLDTRAGPGGRWLSGGERQRIGIARALLRKPGFLVLDEPTAALDRGTEEKLMKALGALEHTMSVVLITHRAELLRLVDRVVEVENGCVRGD